MKSRHKYVPLYFSYTRCDDFAAYLSDMAAKGWKLVSLGAFMKFEEAEPVHTVYDAQVFMNNRENDFVPTQTTLEFSDYCKAAGWEMTDSYRKYVVFREIKSDAVPILSSVEKINSVFRASVRIDLRIFLIMAFYALLWLGVFMNTRPDMFFFHPMSPVITLVTSVVAVCSLIHIIWLILWQRTKKSLLQAGENVYIGNRNFRTGTSVLRFFIPVFLAVFYLMTGKPSGPFLVLLFGELAILVLIIIRRPDAGGTFLISLMGNICIFFLAVVFLFAGEINTSQNKAADYDVPLKAEDLYEPDGILKSAEFYRTESPFGSRTEYISVYTDARNHWDQYFRVVVYRSPYSFAIDKVYDRFTRDSLNLNEIEYAPSELWGTDRIRVYGDSLSYGYYFIAYPNALLEMQIETELDADQIRLIRQRLEL